jgi:hypothetical protein
LRGREEFRVRGEIFDMYYLHINWGDCERVGKKRGRFAANSSMM